MRTQPTDKLLATTLRSIGDAVISCDQEGKIVLMNPEAERLTGWPQTDALGLPLRTIFRVIHGVTREVVEDPVDKVSRLGRVVGLASHTLLIARDGAEVAIDDSAAPILDDKGELCGIVLVFRNVTGRRRAEYNLQFLSRSGQIFSKARDVTNLLHEIGQLAIGHFADLAVFDLRRPDGGIARTLGPHRFPELTAAMEPLISFVPTQAGDASHFKMLNSQDSSVLMTTISEEVLRAGAVSEEHFTFLKEVLKPHSAVISPLKAEDELLGTVTFIRCQNTSPFDALDESTSNELAGRLGLAIQYACVREELAIERARLDAVLESAPIGIMVAGVDGRILSGNAELDGILGHPLIPSQSVAASGERFAMHPDGTRLKAEEYPMARAIQRGETVRGQELLYGTSIDSSTWISISGAPVKGADQTLLGGVVAITNINQQKKAREYLRRSEERFRLLLERASVGINIGDESGRLTYVNPALLRLIGYTKDEVDRGELHWDHLTPEKYAAADQNARTQLQQSGIAQPYEKAFRAKDGHLVPVLLGAAMIPGISSSSDSEDIAVFFTDLTTQKQAESALLQSEKLAAVGKLASSISHEINNPLEAVTNLLFIVRSDSSLSTQAKDYLETADRELARVSQITAQTLRFHRQSTSAQLVRPEALVEEVLGLYSTRLANSNVRITRDYRPGVQLTCYEGDIRQVLNNLIGNAFDAMRQGGHLTIRTRYLTRWSTGAKGIAVVIADTGKGILPEALKNVFDAFYTTKGIHGTGLGLWISCRITHKHRGFIRAYSSVREGTNGSTFMLWLPLQLADTAREPWHIDEALSDKLLM